MKQASESQGSTCLRLPRTEDDKHMPSSLIFFKQLLKDQTQVLIPVWQAHYRLSSTPASAPTRQVFALQIHLGIPGWAEFNHHG